MEWRHVSDVGRTELRAQLKEEVGEGGTEESSEH